MSTVSVIGVVSFLVIKDIIILFVDILLVREIKSFQRQQSHESERVQNTFTTHSGRVSHSPTLYDTGKYKRPAKQSPKLVCIRRTLIVCCGVIFVIVMFKKLLCLCNITSVLF